MAERRLGEQLQAYPRDEYVVSTKVGRALIPTPENAHEFDDDGFRVPALYRREWDFSRDGILRSLEQSLDRLGLDRVDIVYLHDPDTRWEEASSTGIATLVELREQGVVSAIGVGMNQSAMLAEFVRRCDLDLVMLAGRYTLLDQSAEKDLLPLARERGVAVVAAGVYNSGMLSTDEVRDDAYFEYRRASPAILDRARGIATVCARHGVSLPTAAVQFALRQDVVLSAVLGARSGPEMTEGIERATTVVPDALWADLEASGYLGVSR